MGRKSNSKKVRREKKMERKILGTMGNTKIYGWGECIVMVGIEGGRWHLSISKEKEYPTYDEIKSARYEFVPDEAAMAMIFPSKEEFVNLHENCFHLWEIKEKF